MKTEEKVVSQPLAEEMKKAGWEFEAERYWYKDHRFVAYKNKKQWERDKFKEEWGLSYINLSCNNCISAPDAIEIGERLPLLTEDGMSLYIWRRNDGDWFVIYAEKFTDAHFLRETDRSLSEALGKMWLYLRNRRLV